MRSKTIKVDYLARVEGESALHVKIKGDANQRYFLLGPKKTPVSRTTDTRW